MINVDFTKLSIIYESIINETPDSYLITMDNDAYRKFRNYSIDDNISAIISDSVYIAADMQGGGHSDLEDFIYNIDDLGELQGTNFKTNVKSLMELNQLVRHGERIRIWSDDRVVSYWATRVEDSIKRTTLDLMKVLNLDPEKYLYDIMEHNYSDFITYDDFFGSTLSDSDKEAINQSKAEIARGKRAMGDYMAGVNRDRNVPSWQRENGG